MPEFSKIKINMEKLVVISMQLGAYRHTRMLLWLTRRLVNGIILMRSHFTERKKSVIFI